MIAVDTNVFVYRVDPNDVVKQRQAVELLAGLVAGQESPVLMWQVAVEFLRQLRRRQSLQLMTETMVRDYLAAARNLFPMVMPTPSVLQRGFDLTTSHTLSHWDAMLVAACLEAGVDTLYTEDMGAPRMIESLKLVNPFTASSSTAS